MTDKPKKDLPSELMPDTVMRAAQTLSRNQEYDRETEAICTLVEATIDSGEQFRY